MPATAFARSGGARQVLLFGGALVAVQLCDPMGGLVAAGLLPVAGALWLGRAGVRWNTGLYAILFFAPVLTAARLLYVSRTLPFPALVHERDGALTTALPARLALALLPVLISAPAIFTVRAEKAAGAVFAVALATEFALLFGTAMGAVRDPVALMAVGAALSVAALAARALAVGHDLFAIISAMFCSALFWGVAAIVIPNVLSA